MALPGKWKKAPEIRFEPKPWMKGYTMELASSDTLDLMIEECIEARYYGFDLETTGLDTRIFPREGDDGKLIRKTNIDIVGICLSPGKKRGYYVPVRHMPNGVPSPLNIPFNEVDQALRRLMDSEAIPVVFNGKFEGEVMEFNGGEPYGDWDTPRAWEDVLILAFFDDSTRRAKNLKRVSKEVLNKEQIELGELFPEGEENLDFSKLDPSAPGVLEYGCGDAICTIEGWDALREKAIALPSRDGAGKPHSQNFIYLIEKLCVPSIRWMERSRLHIDLNRVEELIEMAERDLLSSLARVYKEASELLGRDITPASHYLLLQRLEKEKTSLEKPLRAMLLDCRAEAKGLKKKFNEDNYGVRKRCEKDPGLGALLAREKPKPKDGIELLEEYDVLAPAKLGTLLWDLGVPGLTLTPSKQQIKTAKDVLDEVLGNKSLDMPFLEVIQWMRGNDNALGKLRAIHRDTDRRDDTLKISFRAYGAATGRFSSKGENKKMVKVTGGTTFNLQSMPATYDKDRPPALLLIRECITPRPYKEIIRFLVAIDFSGVELRLAANLARETKWIEAFFQCADCELAFDRGDGSETPKAPPKFCPRCGSPKIGDIHTLTGIALFGAEAPRGKNWKKRRGQAKNTNFSQAYGGGWRAIQRQTGVSKNEANRFRKIFMSTYRRLIKWWEEKHEFAKKHGYVMTAYYRKFPLPDINHKERFIQSKAKRNAINSPIQGSSADVTKLAMGLLYILCKERDWLDKVKMVITMHDELVFEIDADILEEVCLLFRQKMTRNNAILNKKWPVPLTVDIEIGHNWTVPWDLDSIQFIVEQRRQLQNPDQSEEEARNTLRRIRGFYGGVGEVKKKISSFEDIKWPEDLRPHFKSGQKEKPFTEEEKGTLARAWKMFFEKNLGAATAVPTASPPVTPGEPVFVYKLKSLGLVTAVSLAEVVFECAGKGSHRLELRTPTGERLVGWSDGVMKVDPEAFSQCAKDRHV